MSREHTYFSIILKKQPFGESDELVTVFTKEAGKMRALAKSSKLAKSKLQYGLQVLFLTKLTLTKSNLPKIIGTEIVQTFSRVRDDLEAMKTSYYALELLLKFTADGQKNENLFDLFTGFLFFLNETAGDRIKIARGLAKFKIDFLESVGFAVHAEMPAGFSGRIGFSYSRGGFLFNGEATDFKIIDPSVFSQFVELKAATFATLLETDGPLPKPSELQNLLSGFLEYHLERDIKSERFLNQA